MCCTRMRKIFMIWGFVEHTKVLSEYYFWRKSTGGFLDYFYFVKLGCVHSVALMH